MLIKKVKSPEEIKCVAKLAQEIWSEHYTPIIGKDQVAYMLCTFQSEEAIRTQIEEGYLYYLISNSSEAVGYIGVQLKDEQLFVSKLYVKATERQKGYAKAALAFLNDEPALKEANVISLTVNKHNVQAIRAYERLGFKKLGSVVQDIGKGFVMDDFKMQKQLLKYSS